MCQVAIADALLLERKQFALFDGLELHDLLSLGHPKLATLFEVLEVLLLFNERLVLDLIAKGLLVVMSCFSFKNFQVLFVLVDLLVFGDNV